MMNASNMETTQTDKIKQSRTWCVTLFSGNKAKVKKENDRTVSRVLY